MSKRAAPRVSCGGAGGSRCASSRSSSHRAPSDRWCPFERSTATDQGDGSTRLGTSSGEVDGVRPWREGEGAVGVHWPSTLRAGSLIVHDRHVASDTSWIVPADDMSDEVAAGRLRYTLDEGLRAGHTVSVRRTATGIEPVRDTDEAARQSALVASSRPPDASSPRARCGHAISTCRTVQRRPNPERTVAFTASARWMTALAAFIALAMLVTALEVRPLAIVVIAVGLALGVLVTSSLRRRRRPPTVGRADRRRPGFDRRARVHRRRLG